MDATLLKLAPIAMEIAAQKLFITEGHTGGSYCNE